MASRASIRPRGRPRSRRTVGSLACLALASSLLAACGGGSGRPELVWYINPDSGGQAAVAEACSTSDYSITTQVLPQDASQQRIQLARRLAAKDPAIDLMSLDPPFTAEFADAGFLAEVPQDAKARLEKQGTFQGAMDAATDVQMPKVFEIVLSTGVGRQRCNTCVIFWRMRLGSAHIYIDIFTLAIKAAATYPEGGANCHALSLHKVRLKGQYILSQNKPFSRITPH